MAAVKSDSHQLDRAQCLLYWIFEKISGFPNAEGMRRKKGCDGICHVFIETDRSF